MVSGSINSPSEESVFQGSGAFTSSLLSSFEVLADVFFGRPGAGNSPKKLRVVFVPRVCSFLEYYVFNGFLCGSSLNPHKRARCSMSYMRDVGDRHWCMCFGLTLKTNFWDLPFRKETNGKPTSGIFLSNKTIGRPTLGTFRSNKTH